MEKLENYRSFNIYDYSKLDRLDDATGYIKIEAHYGGNSEIEISDEQWGYSRTVIEMTYLMKKRIDEFWEEFKRRDK